MTHKIIGIMKVKNVTYRVTESGKPVTNVEFSDQTKDKNENWHGADFRLSIWGDNAERVGEMLSDAFANAGKAGLRLWVDGSIDRVTSFKTDGGDMRYKVELSPFSQWRFANPRQAETTPAEESEEMAFN